MDSLLSSLLSSAQAYLAPGGSSEASVELTNALGAVDRLIKEWTTIKLPLGSKVLAEWTSLLLPVLVPLLEELGQREGEELRAGRALKAVSRLAVWDWARRRPAGDEGGASEREARAALVFGLAVRLLGQKVGERAALLAEMRAAGSNASEGARERLKALTAFVKGSLKFLRVRPRLSSARRLALSRLTCPTSLPLAHPPAPQRMQEASPGEFASLPECSAVVLHLWTRTQAGLVGDFHAGPSHARPTRRTVLLTLQPGTLPPSQRTRRALTGQTSSRSQRSSSSRTSCPRGRPSTTTVGHQHPPVSLHAARLT